jgi:hypothetical protein
MGASRAGGPEAVLELPEWGFRVPLAALHDGTGFGLAKNP